MSLRAVSLIVASIRVLFKVSFRTSCSCIVYSSCCWSSELWRSVCCISACRS
jgi:hypothetical protein